MKRTTLVDDLDGTDEEGVDTHRFGVDGVFYEIDLCQRNLQSLLDSLEPFISAGRRVGRDPALIRDWARDNGFAVFDRGAIPGEVLKAYRKANGG